MERSSKALRNDIKFKAVWLLLISLAKLFVSPQLISKYFIQVLNRTIIYSSQVRKLTLSLIRILWRYRLFYFIIHIVILVNYIYL